MLVRGFPAGSFGTNCFVVATGEGEECVVVDPGQDAVPGLDELLRVHRLKPVAVLLTHGHIDHMWSVVPVCGAHGIPAYVHPDDRDLLSDPAKGLALSVGQQLFGGLTFSEPDDVVEISEAGPIELAGVRFDVDLAPGHTPGSIVFRTAAMTGGETAEPVMLAGDLLFAGSIGRVDLPGGDWGQMQDSLRRVVLPLPDETVVLPGHGAATTIGHERATNPFLLDLQDDDAQPPASRGL